MIGSVFFRMSYLDVASHSKGWATRHLKSMLATLGGDGPNPHTMTNLRYRFWQGTRYQAADNPLRGALILADSTYRDEGYNEADPLWLDYYLRTGDDTTFRMVAKAITGRVLSTFAERKACWANIAFYNFIPWILPNSDYEPTEQDKARAIPFLRPVLEILKPRAVWVVGKRHWDYSIPIIKHCGYRYQKAFHPARPRWRSAFLATWPDFRRLLQPGR